MHAKRVNCSNAHIKYHLQYYIKHINRDIQRLAFVTVHSNGINNNSSVKYLSNPKGSKKHVKYKISKMV